MYSQRRKLHCNNLDCFGLRVTFFELEFQKLEISTIRIRDAIYAITIFYLNIPPSSPTLIRLVILVRLLKLLIHRPIGIVFIKIKLKVTRDERETYRKMIRPPLVLRSTLVHLGREVFGIREWHIRPEVVIVRRSRAECFSKRSASLRDIICLVVAQHRHVFFHLFLCESR